MRLPGRNRRRPPFLSWLLQRNAPAHVIDGFEAGVLSGAGLIEAMADLVFAGLEKVPRESGGIQVRQLVSWSSSNRA